MKNIFNLTIKETLQYLISKIDKYFCTPPEKDTEISFGLRQEQYRLFFVYMILQFISKNLIFLASVFTIELQVEVSLILFVHLYLLHKKKLSTLRAFVLISCLIPSLVIYFMDSNILLLSIPVMLIGFCLYCQIVTESIVWGGISYCINAYLILTLYKPKIFIVFDCQKGEKIYEMLDSMIDTAISCVLMVNGVVGFLIESRKWLIKKVMEQQQSLELANKELSLKNSKLETSLKANETFLLSVSHELRNPLNAVLGNMDLALMNKSIDLLVKGFILNAKSSGEMLLHLINNLLDFGKLENSSLETSANPTNTLAFMEKVWSSIKILIQKKGLEGKMYLDKCLPEILCFDHHRLMQIIFNLVGNATKFTDKGTITIIFSWIKEKNELMDKELFSQTSIFETIFPKVIAETEFLDSSQNTPNTNSWNFDEMPFSKSDVIMNKIRNYSSSSNYRTLTALRNKQKFYQVDTDTLNFPKSINNRNLIAEENGFLKIEIKDSGWGMTKNDLTKLFQKFTQVGSNNEIKKLGSGLGLWITKHLCTSMGGDIKVLSEIGKGSVFIVAIKCSTVAQNDIKINKTLPSLSTDCLRALVVDDMKMNQEINKFFLQKCGVNMIDIAANGQEAYDIFCNRGKNYFDIIFMDLDMPVMDGKTSSIKIRQYEKQHNWNSVMLIIITGNCNKKDYDEYLNKDGPIKANNIFSKPFTFVQCWDLITQLHHPFE